MLGDTAVAVHPEDPRYKHLIGKHVDLPLTGRKIPIIADPLLVDPAFGTGVVKVTPGHDPNDYQAGLRNALPMINLLNPDGTYNENAGKYAGIDRLRRAQAGRRGPEGTRPARTSGLVSRASQSLRPEQDADRALPLGPVVRPHGRRRRRTAGFAQQAMDAVTSGRVTIHPERYAKSYLDWLGEKRDWCISRQLWWGHRIPIWYCGTCARTICGPSAAAPTWPGPGRGRRLAGLRRVRPRAATSWELAIP